MILYRIYQIVIMAPVLLVATILTAIAVDTQRSGGPWTVGRIFLPPLVGPSVLCDDTGEGPGSGARACEARHIIRVCGQPSGCLRYLFQSTAISTTSFVG